MVTIPRSAPGAFDVGFERVAWGSRATDITLTAADMGKTHRIQATQQISVTLPDATTLEEGTEIFGMYSFGERIELRLDSGRLFLNFRGAAITGPRALTGVKLDLIDNSTADGVWLIVAVGGTTSVGVLKSNTSVQTEATFSHLYSFSTDIAGDPLITNSPGVVPRIPSGRFGLIRQISENQAIQFQADNTNGTSYRILSIDDDGVVTRGTNAVLSSYVTVSLGNPHVCVLAQNSSGYDYILVIYRSAAATYSARILEITTGTATVNATSAAVVWPTTDNNGKTIEAQPASSNSIYCTLAGVSGTTAYLLSVQINTTDAGAYNHYATLITRSGSVGSPVVTFSVPQRMGTSTQATPYLFGALVSGTANRLFVGSSNYNKDSVWAGDNSTKYLAAVLNTSTAATPTLSYRLTGDYATLTTDGLSAWWYDHVADKIVFPTSVGSTSYEATGVGGCYVGITVGSGSATYDNFGQYTVIPDGLGTTPTVTMGNPGAYSLTGNFRPIASDGSLSEGWIVGGGALTGGSQGAKITASGYFKVTKGWDSPTNNNTAFAAATIDSREMSGLSSVGTNGIFDHVRLSNAWGTWVAQRNSVCYLKSGRYYIQALYASLGYQGRTIYDGIIITMEVPTHY